MKMKTRLLPSLVLMALLGAACAPQATSIPASPVSARLEPSVTPNLPVEPALETPTQDPGVVQATHTPFPVATSRGPELEATDPTTVSLASGQYQFVEFFRFT